MLDSIVHTYLVVQYSSELMIRANRERRFDTTSFSKFSREKIYAYFFTLYTHGLGTLHSQTGRKLTAIHISEENIHRFLSWAAGK